MSAYNKSGDSLLSVYDLEGVTLNQAYDIQGNELYQNSISLKVMSYNCRWFRDFNSQQQMQATIFNSNNADLIGFQEFSTDGTIAQVGQNVLTAYDTIRLSNHKNYLAMASKSITLTDFVIADFIAQDPEDASRYNETRAYMKCYFVIGNKRICWINTHLAYLTASYKYAQMEEVFNLAESEEYVIITGDFNSFNESLSDVEYVNMYKQFVDAGYNLANNSPTAGITNTYTSAISAIDLSEFMYPPDTIITSDNIDIADVVFDTTKLNYYDGTSIDHIPVVATLYINV